MRLQRLVWDKDKGQLVKPSRRTPVAKRFIRGPIPAAWIYRAARLPGRALHVGVLIWEVAGFSSTTSGLAISSERAVRYGVNRFAKRRALGVLERDGLITITRVRGRSPLVSIKRCTLP
jgi:hypothetical protein